MAEGGAVEELFDARGLTCPLPVLRAAKLLKRMPAGGVLLVEATDPASWRDFHSFCDQTGHVMVSAGEGNDCVFRYKIRRAG